VALKGLAHGQVRGSWLRFAAGIGRFELEHLQQPVLAPACNPALLAIPRHAFQANLIRDGNLLAQVHEKHVHCT
jgi:hypothetical protein